MNELDKKALDVVSEDYYSWDRREWELSQEHLAERLTHIDKLESALAWAEPQVRFDQLRDHQSVSWVYRGRETESHDGTPGGRAVALVRLWERVTGGAS